MGRTLSAQCPEGSRPWPLPTRASAGSSVRPQRPPRGPKTALSTAAGRAQRTDPVRAVPGGVIGQHIARP
eukprot:8930118-Alexandrium_andersonii.AAC.1